MTKQEIYETCQTIMSGITNATRWDDLSENAVESLKVLRAIACSESAEKPRCKCQDHKLGGNFYFMSLRFLSTNERAKVLNVFTYCPICGRKL